MSEFKFACPVCGQHITADSASTGTQIPCPTCYRKIVVPQAPASEDSKFVISASEANKPRPPQSPAILEGMQKGPEKNPFPIALVALLVLVCAVGATVFVFRGKIFHSKPSNEAVDNGSTEVNNVATQASAPEPEFTGTNLWTLDLSDAKAPETPVAGNIHGKAFTMERATLTGSNLTLRAGSSKQLELGVTIGFFNRMPEELIGKTAEVKPADTTAPRVVLHWKDAERASKTFHNGYAMRIQFGAAEGNMLPGTVFLCLPDDSKSWVAGTFRAEMRKPTAPKPKPASSRQTQ